MPYIVGLPDGRNVEFPDDVSKEAAASIIRKQFSFPGPETTTLGNVKEAFKGLVPGAVNLVEGAVTGASAMLPDEYEKATREKTKQIAGAIKAPFAAAPGYEDSVVRKLSESVGSTAPFFAMGPFGLAGRAAMVGTGVAAGAGEARTRAEESGATEEQRRAATGLGAVVGSTEALPVFSFLNKLGKPAADALLDKVRRAAATGGQEGAQEIVSAALQNAIAKGVYKPEQSIIEGTGEAGAYGAGTGAIIQGITDMALGRRARQARAAGAPGAPGEAPAVAPIDAALAAEQERKAQAPGRPRLLPENDLFEIASGPSGYAEVAKYKAGLLEQKQTTEVKAAVKEATSLLRLMDAEEYNRKLRDKADITTAVEERGLPTAETSAFNAPAEEVAETFTTETVPEPKVRKKGDKNVAVPPVVESGEATAIEPDGAGPIVPSVAVDSQLNANTPAVQTETRGVGVSKLPVTDGNEPQGLAGSTLTVGDKNYTIVAHTNDMFALQDETGNVTRAMRTGKLGKAIESQLGIEPTVEASVTTAGAPVPTPATEMPAVVAPTAVLEELTAARDALLTSSGKVPAPKSKARKEYDLIQSKIDSLATEMPTVEAPVIAPTTEMPAAGAPAAMAGTVTPTTEMPATGAPAAMAGTVAPTTEMPAAGAPAAMAGTVAPTTEMPAPASNPFATLEKQLAPVDAVVPPLEPIESIDSLREQQDSLRESIAADKKSQAALRTPGGALLPTRKAGYDELQNSIDLTQQKLDAVQEQLKLAKQAKGRDVAPTQAGQIERNKEWFKEEGQREKPEGVKELIQQVVEAVGAYNNPTSDVKRRYVATDFLYSVATEPNQKPSVKQFALQALRNAVDPMDMRPSLRPKYDELVKNVDEDTTDWGSYRYNQTALNNAVPTTEKFTATVASGQTRKAIQTLFTDENAHPLVKLVAERMLKADTLPKVSVVPANSLGVDPKDPDKYRAGVYDAVSDSILLDERGVNGPNFMHEVMHGFLHRKIVDYTRNGYQDAQVKRIDDLYQTLKKNNLELAEQYGMTDLSEFTSEAMSNPEFQEALKTIPYKKSNFFREFARSVLKFFGINDTSKNWNALAEAMIATEAAMQSGRALQEVRTGTEMKGPSTPAVISTPSAVAAATQANVIGDTVERGKLDDFKKAYSKVSRIELIDRLSSIDSKLTAGYLGRLRDSLGNINPKELLAQALDTPRLVERSLVEGFITVNNDGMYVASEGKLANGEEASAKRIMEIVNNSAKQTGRSFAEESKVLSSLIVGHREYELDKYNSSPSSQVVIELRIKDPAIRNRLEREFQTNADAKKVVEIMDGMRFNRIDMMVYAGRISQDKADFWKSTSGYVPYQDLDNLNDKITAQKTGSGKGLSSTAKYLHIRGDDTQVGNVIDSFVDLMSRMTSDAVKVNAVNRSATAMTLLGHAKRISPAAPLSQTDKEHTVDTFVNGKPARYFFNDALDAAAFGAIPTSVSSLVQAAQSVARVLRAGVTLVPGFAVGQVITDLTRAYALSDVANPAALIPRILMNFPRAAFGELTGRKKASVVELENMGVAATFDVSTQGTIQNIMEQVGAEKRGIVGSILHVAETISKASDIAVRQAIYEQSIEETGDKALSMSRAREIINFSRRGKNNTVDFLVRTVPFTNAYIRGMDKLYTAATGTAGAYGMTQPQAKRMFISRIGTLSALGFVYAMMMAGDDEYESLDDSIRDSRFILPFGKIDGALVSVPLPRDLAFIFKAIPERVVNYVRKHGTEEEQNGMLVIGELLRQGLVTLAAPNVTPSMLLPVLENIGNYSTFLDRPLESQSQQGKEAFMSFGRGTSEVSKEISNGMSVLAKQFNDMGLSSMGAMFEMSPVKIENLLRGWFGTSAALALSMGDSLLAPERTAKSPHKEVLAQITGISAIMTDPVGRKQLNEFYETYEKVSKVKRTLSELERTNPDKATEYAKGHVPEMEVADYMEILRKDIQERNETIRLIDRELSLSADEKLKAVSALVKEQNEMAKGVRDVKRHLLKRE